MINILKRTSALILACYAAISLAAEIPSAAKSKLSFSYVQISDEATLRAVKSKPGFYYISLKLNSPNVFYFSNKPHEIAGVMPIENYLKLWRSPNNPSGIQNINAFLSGKRCAPFVDKGYSNFVFTLNNPVYTIDKNVVTYEAKLVKGSNLSLTKTPLTLVSAYLFLDACWGCD